MPENNPTHPSAASDGSMDVLSLGSGVGTYPRLGGQLHRQFQTVNACVSKGQLRRRSGMDSFGLS